MNLDEFLGRANIRADLPHGRIRQIAAENIRYWRMVWIAKGFSYMGLELYRVQSPLETGSVCAMADKLSTFFVRIELILHCMRCLRRGTYAAWLMVRPLPLWRAGERKRRWLSSLKDWATRCLVSPMTVCNFGGIGLMISWVDYQITRRERKYVIANDIRGIRI